MTVQLIACFPGTGQENLYRNDPTKITRMLYADDYPTDFPKQYTDHIKELLNDQDGLIDIIIIEELSSILDALEAQNIPYTLVYPDISLKEEYFDYYLDHGYPQDFIAWTIAGWDDWIDDLTERTLPTKIILRSGQSIADLFGN